MTPTPFSPGAAADLVPITTAEAEGQGPRKDYLQKGSHIRMFGFVSQYISSEWPALWLESGHPFKKCPSHKNICNFFIKGPLTKINTFVSWHSGVLV